MGIIVLDGPDGTGKTTLATHLRDAHGARMFHLGSKHAKNAFLNNWAMLENLLHHHEKGRLVVLDRMWLSEHVYGSVFRPDDNRDDLGRLMHRVLLTHGALHVVCTGDTDELVAQQSVNQDPDHPYDDVRFRRVCDMYRFSAGLSNKMTTGTSLEDMDAAYRFQFTYGATLGRYLQNKNRKPIPWCFIYNKDWEGKDLQAYGEYLVYQVDQQRVFANRWSRKMAGSSRAVLLMVGDRVNKTTNKTPWPFFSDKNSSRYLSDVLNKLAIPETDLLWINSDDLDVLEHTCDYAIERGLSICLLGKAALKQFSVIQPQLEKDFSPVGVEAAVFHAPHPSHSNRFGDPDGNLTRSIYDAYKRGLNNVF